jgi:hypothetical protein
VAVGVLLDRMEAAGLVRRDPDPVTAAVFAAITPRGRAPTIRQLSQRVPGCICDLRCKVAVKASATPTSGLAAHACAAVPVTEAAAASYQVKKR